MSRILVTGGTGYVGSHTCLALLKSNYKITILDSLTNSKIKTIEKIKEIAKDEDKKIFSDINFELGDIRDYEFLEKVFSNQISKGCNFAGVIHFCGLKSVAESMNQKLDYWDVNVNGTINLIKIMKKYHCYNLVFSSSATVYGNNHTIPIKENSEIKPVNTYGQTKAVIEKFLKDVQEEFDSKFKIAALRFFNPVGAHHSGLIGELPLGTPNNIFPLILDTASGIKEKFNIYGKDWPTHDGTAIRDYIHVMDVGESHIRILEYLISNRPNYLCFNVGTGIGTSVLELIKVFEKVNKVEVPFVFSKRRCGDVPYLVADNFFLKSKFNIFPKRNIEDMCRDAWRWRLLNPNGY